MSKIPKDLILIISGVSCVGKTTIAYDLLKKFDEFKRVTEVDILRTVVREIVKDIGNDNFCVNKATFEKQFEPLFQSLTYSDTNMLKEQSKILLKYVRAIVKRQQARKIPTIIEGLSIVPSVYFDNNKPLDGFEKNVLFINLYISNEFEHIRRRKNRCFEREYTDSINAINEKISNIRNGKNDLLHKETLELSTKVTNVFSIDVSNPSYDNVLDQVSNIIYFFIKEND